MAFRVTNHFGAETGTTDESSGSSGTVGVTQVSPAHQGSLWRYSIGSAAGTYLEFPMYVRGRVNDHFGFEAWIMGSSATAGPIVTVWDDSNSSEAFRIDKAAASGGLSDLLVYDANNTQIGTATDALSDNTWHLLSVYSERSATVGKISVKVDRRSVLDLTGEDTAATGNESHLRFGNACARLDSAYVASDLSQNGIDDLKGGAEVFAYRSSLASATAELYGITAPPDLTTGQWVDAQSIPFNAGSEIEFGSGWSTTLNNEPGVLCNDLGGSSGGGPNGDNYVTGTIEAFKGTWKARRGNGSGTTHWLWLGAATGIGLWSPQVLTPSLTTSDAIYEYMLTGAMPTTSDYLGIGAGKSSGGRELYVTDMLAQILHIPPPPASLPPIKPGPRNFQHLLVR